MGLRDLIWAVVICAGLNYAFHTRPLGQARTFVEKESLEGFRRAFVGRKLITGEVIVPQAGGKTFDDVTKDLIRLRNLELEAEQLGWNGKRAELIARHVVKLDDGTTEGTDVGHRVHVVLERDGDDWHYAHFQVLGEGAPVDPGSENPWQAALASAAKL